MPPSAIYIHGILIHTLDLIALCWFLLAWFGYSYYARKHYGLSDNLVSITGRMRAAWMRQMLLRDNRMVDAALIGNLLRGITFFASTSIFVLIGLVTMMGYREEALSLIDAIPFAVKPSALMWEFKVFLMAFIFVYAFFKYTWSLRLYNYASILVGTARESSYYQKNAAEREAFARRGGDLIANAGEHFNMGLRAYYFGLAILSWFIHPWVFIILIAWVVYEVHRREFRSHAVNQLAEMDVITGKG